MLDQEIKLIEIHSALLALQPDNAPGAYQPGDLSLRLELIGIPTINGQTGGNTVTSTTLSGTLTSTTATASVTIPTNRPSVVSASATFTLVATGSALLYVDGRLVVSRPR